MSFPTTVRPRRHTSSTPTPTSTEGPAIWTLACRFPALRGAARSSYLCDDVTARPSQDLRQDMQQVDDAGPDAPLTDPPTTRRRRAYLASVWRTAAGWRGVFCFNTVDKIKRRSFVHHSCGASRHGLMLAAKPWYRGTEAPCRPEHSDGTGFHRSHLDSRPAPGLAAVFGPSAVTCEWQHRSLSGVGMASGCRQHRRRSNWRRGQRSGGTGFFVLPELDRYRGLAPTSCAFSCQDWSKIWADHLYVAARFYPRRVTAAPFPRFPARCA